MNVLVLTSTFPRKENDATAAFVCELSHNLQKNGTDISVLAPHFPGGQIVGIWHSMHIFRFVYFLPTGLERLAYGPGLLFNAKRDFIAFIEIPFFIIAEFFWTALILRQQKIQVIHSHWLIPQGVIGAIFRRVKKIPHVVTVHGGDLNTIKSSGFLKPLCLFVIRNSDRITVNSTYTRKQLESIAPLDPEKVSVVPMGIDHRKFQRKDSDELKKKFNAHHVILSLGRLIDIKGTIYLIRALPEILTRHPDTVLLIAGDGPERERLVRESSDLGLETKVHFLGAIQRTESLELFGQADVFILPSIDKDGHTEAQGVVILEAMASGCPVVGSNVGGIPDMIQDGENGFLVPEKDPGALAAAINRLLSSDELREKFRKNGLLTIQKSFTWGTISARFSALYSEAAHEPEAE